MRVAPGEILFYNRFGGGCRKKALFHRPVGGGHSPLADVRSSFVLFRGRGGEAGALNKKLFFRCLHKRYKTDPLFCFLLLSVYFDV